MHIVYLNLPPERFPLCCWSPLEGTFTAVGFLDPSEPDMLGTLKLPCRLWSPWRDPIKTSSLVKVQHFTEKAPIRGGNYDSFTYKGCQVISEIELPMVITISKIY